MKKIKTTLTLFACITGVALAFDSRYDTAVYGVFGKDYMGWCVEGEGPLEEGCGNSGIYICHVYLPMTGEITHAFKTQVNSNNCAIPYRRW